MRIKLPFTDDAYTLYSRIYMQTVHHKLPEPAALIGQWHNYQAIIIPSVHWKPDIPLSPGWFGYLSYPDRIDEARLPYSMATIVDGGIYLDHDNLWWWISSYEVLPKWIAELTNDTERVHQEQKTLSWSIQWYEPNRQQHHHMVNQCHKAIRQGDIYQANLCSNYTGKLHGSAQNFFIDTGSQLRARKSAYIGGPFGAIASFSPETFFIKNQNKISMSPIKGTLPIDQNADLLYHSTKDRAENMMIVDVVRNDLSKLAQYGTVNVSELFAIYPAPGVWQMQSSIEASLKDGCNYDEIFTALFPIASVTGAPKIKACELIATWESTARGTYCGTIGFITPDGQMDFSVLIRGVEITPNRAVRLGVGGGITIDSQAHAEYLEMLAKAHPIITARPTQKFV